MSKATKASKKTEADTSPVGSSTTLTSIANMLEDHRVIIAVDFKASFAALELRLDKMQTMITEHGQRMDPLESHAELQAQRIQALEERCVALADSNAKLTTKTIDLEIRSRRNNQDNWPPRINRGTQAHKLFCRSPG